MSSLTFQHQIATLVLLGSEHWHLNFSTCHHCSCSICQVCAVFVSHSIICATGNVMGELSEAELQQLQMHALELRHLQQLSVLDLAGADCVNATSERGHCRGIRRRRMRHSGTIARIKPAAPVVEGSAVSYICNVYHYCSRKRFSRPDSRIR